MLLGRVCDAIIWPNCLFIIGFVRHVGLDILGCRGSRRCARNRSGSSVFGGAPRVAKRVLANFRSYLARTYAILRKPRHIANIVSYRENRAISRKPRHIVNIALPRRAHLLQHCTCARERERRAIADKLVKSRDDMLMVLASGLQTK